MDGLAGYGSDDAEDSPKPTPVPKPKHEENGSGGDNLGKVDLQAEWASFEALVGGHAFASEDGESVAATKVEPDTAPADGAFANGSLKQHGKSRKKKLDSSSSSSSEDDSDSSSTSDSSDTEEDKRRRKKKKKKKSAKKSKKAVREKSARAKKSSKAKRKKKYSTSSSSDSESDSESSSESSSSESEEDKKRSKKPKAPAPSIDPKLCRQASVEEVEPIGVKRSRSKSMELTRKSLEKQKSDVSEVHPQELPKQNINLVKERKSKSPVKTDSAKDQSHGKREDQKKRNYRSRSRERRRPSRKSRSRSRDRRSRSRSRDRKSGSRSRDRKSRSRSRDRKKRSRSRDRKRHRSRDRKRSRSKDRKKRPRSRSRGRKKRSRSRSRGRRSRSRGRGKRSPRRRRKSRERRRKERSRSPHREKRRSRSKERKKSRSKSRSPPPKAKANQPLSFKEQLKQNLMAVQKKAAEGGLQLDPDAEAKLQKMVAAGSEKAGGVSIGSALQTVKAANALSGAQVTPQEAFLQTMQVMHQKAQEMTGISVPKYYNPAAVNPLKYAEQVQKRKLLWSKQPKEQKEHVDQKIMWTSSQFGQDEQGKTAAKFRKLMGIKGAEEAKGSETMTEEQKRKHQEMFSRLDKEYEFARMATHTHRGMGLGTLSHSYSGAPETSPTEPDAAKPKGDPS